MLKVETSLIWPGYAQGKYTVKARGFILAILRWGNDAGSLDNWSPFAYVPIDPAGNGTFFFSGQRGIPREATHVWARCFTHDFTSFEDTSAEIPKRYILSDVSTGDTKRFSILTDLHLSAKPWKITQALKATESDTLFLLGDSTNDGLPEQFERFKACIEETVPGKTIFPVIGNHDVLRGSRENNADGCRYYAEFQKYLLTKAETKGYAVSHAPDGRAYSVSIGDLDVIGLQCVTTKRMFIFPEEKQLDWLENHIETTSASRHIILCHAPLLAHNPNRNTGQPYLHRNKRIQEIVDRNGRVIFLSGHTHVSPNVLTGNGECDKEHHNIYLDCGSVVSTDTSGESGLMSPDWKDGCKTELSITGDEIEICMSSIESRIRFPRGYYRFFVREMTGKQISYRPEKFVI